MVNCPCRWFWITSLSEPTYRQLIYSHSAGVNIYPRCIQKALITTSSWVTPIIRIHDQTIINTDLKWDSPSSLTRRSWFPVVPNQWHVQNMHNAQDGVCDRLTYYVTNSYLFYVCIYKDNRLYETAMDRFINILSLKYIPSLLKLR